MAVKVHPVASTATRWVSGSHLLFVVAGYLLGAGQIANFPVADVGGAGRMAARGSGHNASFAKLENMELHHTYADWIVATFALVGQPIPWTGDDWTSPPTWPCKGSSGEGPLWKRQLCMALQETDNAASVLLQGVIFLVVFACVQVMMLAARVAVLALTPFASAVGVPHAFFLILKDSSSREHYLFILACMAVGAFVGWSIPLEFRKKPLGAPAAPPAMGEMREIPAVAAESVEECEVSQELFAVTLELRPGARLGFHCLGDGANLRVQKIDRGMALDEWNKEYPARAMRVGDLIHEVNGVRGGIGCGNGRKEFEPLLDALRNAGAMRLPAIDLVVSHTN